MYEWQKRISEFGKHERDMLGVLTINTQVFFSVDSVCEMTPLWHLTSARILGKLERAGWVVFAHRAVLNKSQEDKRVFVGLRERVARRQKVHRLKLRKTNYAEISTIRNMEYA